LAKTITVIIPLVKINEPFILGRVYYPYMFYHVEVLIKGILKEPKKVKGYVAIDLVRGLTFMADSMPKTYKVSVDEKYIVPPKITIEHSEHLAKKKMVYVAMRRFKAIFPATINILSKKLAYKQFIIAKRENKVVIIDTVTGEYEELK